MEEKKSKKISLSTIICCVIILLLSVTILVIYFYYNNLTKTIEGSDKNMITAEKFKEYIETKGFNVHKEDEIYNLAATIKEGTKQSYFTEKNDKDDFRINFFEFIDESNVMYHYYQAVLSTETNNNGMFTENSEKSLNHTKYSAVSNGNYIVVSRIKDTLIWGTINAENRQDLDNIIEDLGY